MSKIVLIGANHAGTACANTILDNYKDEELVIFDQNSNISFLGCGMALWIGKQIKGPEKLFYCSKEVFEQKGATVHMETKVDNIDYDKKIVYAKDKDGKEIQESYDKLVLATGSQPILPDIEGMDLENVQKVKIFQDAQSVIDKINHEEIKKVVVVGAGYIGTELAEAFKRLGKESTLIEHGDTVLRGYYDDKFCKKMEDNLRNHGVNLVFNEEVVKLEGTDGKVNKVITDKGEYDCDMVIMSIGFKPNSSLAKDHLKLNDKKAIITDKNQQTSDENVFAVGDSTVIFNNATGKFEYVALATNAVRSGIVAGHNVCGTKLESNGVQGSNGIKIYDLCMVSTGLTVRNAEKLGMEVEYTDFTDLQKPPFMEENNKEVTIRIVYDKNSREIKGCQIMSEYDISMMIHMFSLAIQEHVTIDKLALTDIFFLPHYNQPYNYVTMAAIQAL